MTAIEIARAFGLVDDSTAYRSIESMEATAIATRILSTGLAHDSKIMSASRAADLWQQFTVLFDGDVEFASNTDALANSWTPATRATFDMGVLVIGASKAGCLWIDEED